jgi:hypothetical protein
MSEIKRLYSMEDELMLTRAATQKGNLQNDLAAFTAKFPWINAAYVTSYQTDITTADAIPRDNTVMTDVKVLTADVNASVVEGREALSQLFRYAEITYPTDKVRQRVFGQDLLAKARSDQEKMENLLEHANGFADKLPYKTDLIAKGYTQPQIDNLLTISDNINTKNLLQEAAKSSRPVSTQDRISVYNIVFERMQTISTCAQEVFEGNPAKIQQYQIYPPAGAPTSATMHVTDGTNNINGVSVKVLNFSGLPAEITDASGNTQPFPLGNSPGDTIDIEVTGAGIINPSPQTFNDKDILEGEDNTIEIVVTV